MDNTEMKEVGEQLVKKKRTRPDSAIANSVHTEKGEMSRFIEHAMESWDWGPVDLDDAEQVQDRIQLYFQSCAIRDMKPTVAGMCNRLGMTRQTFFNWCAGKNKQATHQAIARKAKQVLEELMEDYMVNGKINPVSGIFLLKNNFGYTDKQEITIEPKQTVIEPTSMDDIMQLCDDNDIESSD